MSDELYTILTIARSYLPPSEVVRSYFSSLSRSAPDEVFRSISEHSMYVEYLPILRAAVSDMTRPDLANVLIGYLDIHYHDVLVEIDSNDESRNLFRGIMSNIVTDLLSGSHGDLNDDKALPSPQ